MKKQGSKTIRVNPLLGLNNPRESVSTKRVFSLLELLIYMGLLAVVMLAIGGIFVGINAGRSKAEVQAEVNSNLQFAIQQISNDLRGATTVTSPLTAGTASTTLVFTNAVGTTTYCVVSGVLRRQTGGEACTASSDAITASTVLVTTSTFTRLENTNSFLNKTAVSVQIDLALSYNSTNPESQYSEEKVTTVSLRN